MPEAQTPAKRPIASVSPALTDKRGVASGTNSRHPLNLLEIYIFGGCRCRGKGPVHWSQPRCGARGSGRLWPRCHAPGAGLATKQGVAQERKLSAAFRLPATPRAMFDLIARRIHASCRWQQGPTHA